MSGSREEGPEAGSQKRQWKSLRRIRGEVSALLSRGWATLLSSELTGEAEIDRIVSAITAMERRLNNMIDRLVERLILQKLRVILKVILMKMVLFSILVSRHCLGTT